MKLCCIGIHQWKYSTWNSTLDSDVRFEFERNLSIEYKNGPWVCLTLGRNHKYRICKNCLRKEYFVGKRKLVRKPSIEDIRDIKIDKLIT